MLLAAATALLAACVPLRRDDARVARLEVLALLQTLNSDLLSHDSATLTLERWCADHRLADSARIVARRVRGEAKPLPADLRALLAVGPDAPIGYRHVQLACGERVLSEADNWYVPERLTADMNRTLDTTDEPFGKVVRPLAFQRHTLSAELLWSPLPHGWALGAPSPAGGADAPVVVPHAVLRHRAVLTAPGGAISVVEETYSNQVLAFPIAGVRLAD